MVDSVWVPVHSGVEGNKAFHILAKQSLKSQMIDIQIPLSRTEGKSIFDKWGNMERTLGH